MKFVPATTQSAVVHAYKLTEYDAERSMAMWAGSHLMALHDRRSELLQQHAAIWAEKLEPRAPLSEQKR